MNASTCSTYHEVTSPANDLNGDPGPGNLLHVDHKPRLLLMGLKRCVEDLHFGNLSYSD